MKVLHCPTDTGGNPWVLSRAERKLGIESDMMVFRSQWFGYPNDIDLHFEKVPPLIRELKRWKFFKFAIKKYDVFNFNFGRSVLDYRVPPLSYLDFSLLKKSGKKIIVTFQGCDARIKDYCLKNFEISGCAECDVKHCNVIWNKIKKMRIRKVIRYADKIYALNPDLIYNCPPAEFQPYANVDLEKWIPTGETKSDEIIRILHAPPMRGRKGTKYVLETYERLKREKYPVELLLVENIPHDQIKNFYQRADIVVDQLLVGWYGGVAVEAMALAKPVLCYLRKEDLEKFISFRDEIPIINTTSTNLHDNLITLIEDEKLREKIGKKSRSYVEKIHDPVNIAKQLIKVYRET